MKIKQHILTNKIHGIMSSTDNLIMDHISTQIIEDFGLTIYAARLAIANWLTKGNVIVRNNHPTRNPNCKFPLSQKNRMTDILNGAITCTLNNSQHFPNKSPGLVITLGQ